MLRFLSIFPEKKYILQVESFIFYQRYFYFSGFPTLHLDSLFQHNEALPAVVQYIPDFSFRNKVVIPAFSWPAFAINIFYAGILMMFVRFAIQIFSILLIRKKANTQKLHGILIINTKENISPFSFFNEIYINPQQHTASETEQIVRHEMIHAKQYHSVDILLSEIFTIIFWFNPFAWLLKKTLKQNLKFLTDRQVLATGIDAKLYQYCLLKVSGIHTNMAVSSHFNFSKLKNRIIMMNKKKSLQLNVFKYLLLAPVAAFLLMAFNGSVKNMRSGIRNFITNDTVPDTPTPPPPIDEKFNIPAPPPPEDVLIEIPDSVKNFYRQNETVKIIRPKNGGKLVVTLKNGKTEVYDLNNESNRKIFEKKYGKPALPPPPPPPPLPPTPSQQQPTVLVPVVAMSAPVKVQLASVKIVEPVMAISSKNVRPTIVASTSSDPIIHSKNIIAAEGAKASSKPKVIATQANDVLLADEWMANALYYINGKEVTRDIALAIDPEKIIRIEVYPSPDAVKKFGEKGTKGIIEINTK